MWKISASQAETAKGVRQKGAQGVRQKGAQGVAKKKWVERRKPNENEIPKPAHTQYVSNVAHLILTFRIYFYFRSARNIFVCVRVCEYVCVRICVYLCVPHSFRFISCFLAGNYSM